MKTLNKIDLTKEGEPKYITYFYHKYNRFVFEVTSNGKKCASSLMDEVGINKAYKFNSKLPKYIKDKL